MTNLQVIALALLLAIGLTTMLPLAASAASNLIGDLVKVFGIGYVVSRFGPQINKFINSLASQKGVKWDGLTKVVPIISVGSGLFVGAAQVQGTQSRVSGVKAVGQVETRVSGFRARLLVPVGTNKLRKGSTLDRIPGVGVSGLIDFKI